MTDVKARADDGLTTRGDQPLIGVLTHQGIEEIVQYFTSEEEADRARSEDTESLARALQLIGAWEHIDNEDGPDMLEELDRIRHQSKPTPPLEL